MTKSGYCQHQQSCSKGQGQYICDRLDGRVVQQETQQRWHGGLHGARGGARLAAGAAGPPSPGSPAGKGGLGVTMVMLGASTYRGQASCMLKSGGCNGFARGNGGTTGEPLASCIDEVECSS